MGKTFDDLQDAAVAEMARLDAVVTKLEAAVADAMDRADRIAEPTDTPERATEIERMAAAADEEAGRLDQERAEAQDDWERARDDLDRLLADADDTDDDESLPVDEAADAWLSSGKDEDYMFGYTQGELERAAGL